MPRRVLSAGPEDTRLVLLETWAVNVYTNQFLLEQLDPRAWRAEPPGGSRTIAAIFAHVHNIRRKWLRLSAPHLGLPVELDPAVPLDEVIEAMARDKKSTREGLGFVLLAEPGEPRWGERVDADRVRAAVQELYG